MIINSKDIGVKRDPERVHWGQTQFQVNDDPEIGQFAAEYDSELGQSDLNICYVWEADQILGHFDLEWGPTLMDPFPGHVDPGDFRVFM